MTADVGGELAGRAVAPGALLLEGAPVFGDGDFERTTPTGALLVGEVFDISGGDE